MKLMTWKFCEYKVFVYRNLHQKCWSVRSLSRNNYGRVILHCTSVDLSGAVFKVNEKGRQRVIAEQAKNVHAGVVGYLDGAHVITQRYDGLGEQHVILDQVTGGAIPTTDRWKEVTYNPYMFDSFVYADGFEPAIGKFDVMLCDDMKVRALPAPVSIAA